MNIQDVLVFQDPVKGGYLMVDKNVEKKIGPVFRGPQAREPQQQIPEWWSPGSNSRIKSPFRLNCAPKASVLPIAKVVLIFIEIGLFFIRMFI